MLYYSLEKVITCLQHGERYRVLDILQNHDVHETDFYRTTYLCFKCKRFCD